jgi:hypothetical protein
VKGTTQDLNPNHSLTLFSAHDEDDTGSTGTQWKDFGHELRDRLAELEAEVTQVRAQAEALKASILARI